MPDTSITAKLVVDLHGTTLRSSRLGAEKNLRINPQDMAGEAAELA